MKSYVHETDAITRMFLNSPRLFKTNTDIELFDENNKKISRKQRDLLLSKRTVTDFSGVIPYNVSVFNYITTHAPEFITKNEDTNYLVIGSIKNKDKELPWELYEGLAIGPFKRQKKLLELELARYTDPESGSHYRALPVGDGRLTLAEPFRIQVYTKKREEIKPETLAMLDRIGREQLGGVILEAYAPLFGGGLDNHTRYSNQPPALYAIIRDHNKKLLNRGIYDSAQIFNSETTADTRALTVMKMFSYLVVYDNDIGETKEIDLADMLRSVAPECLKGEPGKETFRWDRTVPLFFNCYSTLRAVMEKYPTAFDFVLDNIFLDTPIGDPSLMITGKWEQALKDTIKHNKGKLKIKVKRNPKVIPQGELFSLP